MSWILKQLYKSPLNPYEESIWRHVPTVVQLASSWLFQQTLFTLLVWDGVQPRGLLSPSESSQSSLFGMAAHQRSRVWEETSKEGANRTVTVLWTNVSRIGFQCGKDDGEGQKEVADNSGAPRNHSAWWRKLSFHVCGNNLGKKCFLFNVTMSLCTKPGP